MGAELVDRVRAIISATGRTQREVAELIGIDAPKLTKSLKGVRQFTSYELAAIADLGGRTIQWLLDGTEPRTFAFTRRAQLQEPSIADLAGQEIVEVLGERYDSAIRLGMLPEPPPLPTVPRGGTDIARGQWLAEWAVSRIGVPLAGLPTWELADRIDDAFGINVVVAELPDGVDGLSYQEGSFRIIVLDTTERVGRQRFTLAHELGHVLLGDAAAGHDRDGRTEKRERTANSFAAAFLAPEAELRVLLGGSDPTAEFDRIAWELWLTPETLAWRLRGLDLIDESSRRALGARSQVAAARRIGKETEHIRRVIQARVLRPPKRLTDAYLSAFLSGDVAARTVTQLTGLSEGTLESMLADYEGIIDEPSHGEDATD